MEPEEILYKFESYIKNVQNPWTFSGITEDNLFDVAKQLQHIYGVKFPNLLPFFKKFNKEYYDFQNNSNNLINFSNNEKLIKAAKDILFEIENINNTQSFISQVTTPNPSNVPINITVHQNQIQSQNQSTNISLELQIQSYIDIIEKELNKQVQDKSLIKKTIEEARDKFGSAFASKFLDWIIFNIGKAIKLIF